MALPNKDFSSVDDKREVSPVIIFIGVCFGVSLLVFSGVQIWDRVKLHSLGDEMIDLVSGINDETNTLIVVTAENSKLKSRVNNLERRLKIANTELRNYKDKEKTVLGTFGDAVRIEENGSIRYESTTN